MRIALLLALAGVLLAQAPAKRKLALDDIHATKSVGGIQVSPDGAWVAYTLSTIDAKKDESQTDLWMVSFDGTKRIQLTHTADQSESSPKWSPDNRHLAFVSSRPGPTPGGQIWILDRLGGEAKQLTNIKTHSISGFEWSPDSKTLALVMQEKEDAEDDEKKADKPKTKKPIVIDRYKFKQDGVGYLTSKFAKVHLFDIATQKTEPLTEGADVPESSPKFTPDGKKIAFVSNRNTDWERTGDQFLFLADAKPKQKPTAVTKFWLAGSQYSISPDGQQAAVLQGVEPAYRAYTQPRLVIQPLDGSAHSTLDLDRPVGNPLHLGDRVAALITDDQVEYLATWDLKTKQLSKKPADKQVINTFHGNAQGKIAALLTTDNAIAEAHVWDADKQSWRAVTNHNEWLTGVELGKTEDVAFKAKDGNEAHGLLTYPPDYDATKKYPLLLRIHGGPNGQDAHAFQFERHLFAAHGYLVLQVNYRGSNGRGEAFQRAIFNDWGNKEVLDLLAGVDHVVAKGIVDPARLGIGGWSYGGILTDYTIASDTRFKAAISGAGTGLMLSNYGNDHYIIQSETEVGLPWKPAGMAKWMKHSYPFTKVDQIVTPTLFVHGERDFNVPIIGSEQMYQAMKSIGKADTQFVIYPGEFHGIRKPSYRKDLMQRYLDWYAKYLKPTAAATR